MAPGRRALGRGNPTFHVFQSISIHVFVEQMAGLFNIFSHMGFVYHL